MYQPLPRGAGIWWRGSLAPGMVYDVGFFCSVGSTYACQLGAAVTAFGCSALLLDVQVSELATWSLDDADVVGLGVV